MTSASMKEQLDNLGFESSYRNSADFAQYIQAETDKYSAIIKQANITAE
jgi:tripartite-type tricarboxylate transporter receptor subunit TctC